MVDRDKVIRGLSCCTVAPGFKEECERLNCPYNDCDDFCITALCRDALALLEPHSCAGCKHNLGGGYNNCRINLEAECAAGNYEAWEAADP